MLNSHTPSEQSEEYISPGRASKIAFVSTRQLSRYADEGRIRFIKPGKHRRYLESDVKALAAKPGADTGLPHE